MGSIILIFICLFAGVALRRIKKVPANAHVALNQFAIYISLPALSLYYIPKIKIDTSLLYPAGVAWIGFLLSWLFFTSLSKIFLWPRKLTGCLILLGGLGNTSFIGYPVIQALYGQDGLKVAIITDQPGSFVVLSTLGIFTALKFSGKRVAGIDLLKNILFFPPFVGFFIGLCLNISGFDFIPLFQDIFLRLGNTVTAIALVAVGLQLKIDIKSRHWKFLWLGLLFKLIITPLVIFILYYWVFGHSGQAMHVSVLEAAMPPMITAAILASANGLKPKLAGMMIGIGIPLSFLTLALWYIFLKS
ncbi:AEC family transporter [Flavobacterium rhizosphaerae]|uniref:AEC family transporter n=1 Tax=Flavobacterium rhizosphaerae TaxID=3163298 RepID=A0ABW8YUE2_9FLAO